MYLEEIWLNEIIYYKDFIGRQNGGPKWILVFCQIDGFTLKIFSSGGPPITYDLRKVKKQRATFVEGELSILRFYLESTRSFELASYNERLIDFWSQSLEKLNIQEAQTPYSPPTQGAAKSSATTSLMRSRENFISRYWSEERGNLQGELDKTKKVLDTLNSARNVFENLKITKNQEAHKEESFEVYKSQRIGEKLYLKFSTDSNFKPGPQAAVKLKGFTLESEKVLTQLTEGKEIKELHIKAKLLWGHILFKTKIIEEIWRSGNRHYLRSTVFERAEEKAWLPLKIRLENCKMYSYAERVGPSIKILGFIEIVCKSNFFLDLKILLFSFLLRQSSFNSLLKEEEKLPIEQPLPETVRGAGGHLAGDDSDSKKNSSRKTESAVLASPNREKPSLLEKSRSLPKSKLLSYVLERAKEFQPREKLNRVNDLKGDQLKVFQRLKEKFEERGNANKPMVMDDNSICRFMIARNYDYKKTDEMISNYLDWRFENGVDYLNVEEFNDYDQFLMNLATVIGSDRMGHPVIYVRSKNYLPKKIAFDRFKKCILSLVEAIVEQLPDHTDQYVIITDTRDFSSENDYYPNRLYAVYVLHTLTFIQMIWQGLKVFVHPITREKINFLGSNANQIYETLVKHMEPKAIPLEYGGLCEIDI